MWLTKKGSRVPTNRGSGFRVEGLAMVTRKVNMQRMVHVRWYMLVQLPLSLPFFCWERNWQSSRLPNMVPNMP